MTGTRFCPHCGQEVPEYALVCPHCGEILWDWK